MAINDNPTPPSASKAPAAVPYQRDADQPQDTDKRDAPSGGDDVGQDEVQERTDKAEDQGYFGTKVDPRPNDDYALTSGPDSPGAVDDDVSRIGQRHISEETDR